MRLSRNGVVFSLVMVVLVLYNLACWHHPVIVDELVRRFDVRMWPSWYFPAILAVYGVFLYRERRRS